MKDTLSKIVIFAAGAAIGSAVTWKLLKTKYEQLAQEEIDSVMETFSKKNELDQDKTEAESEPESTGAQVLAKLTEKPDIREYAAKLQGYGYTNYANATEPEQPKVDYDLLPYIIKPEDFGEEEGYDEISLTYYADGYLTDDRDELVEDVEGTVGYESLDHIGDYEEDAIHVRNDRLKADYEILFDMRNFSDIRGSRHYPTED